MSQYVTTGTFKSLSILNRGHAVATTSRALVEETPVAVVHDAATYAVMMATPCDLEDFAIGLSLNEGVITTAEEVRSIDVVETQAGIEVRLWLPPGHASQLALRRRTLIGPTGCGLCGVESLEQALPRATFPPQAIAPLSADQIHTAMDALKPQQILGRATRAAHAAGFWTAHAGLVMLREDVGRHNALDKLVGGLARAGTAPAGLLLLTSRISVELVQKAAKAGFPVMAGISAPTALAVRTADQAGVTLVGVVRDDGLEVFTHMDRILTP